MIRQHSDGVYTGPVVECDGCGARITNAGLAGISWARDAAEEERLAPFGLPGSIRIFCKEPHHCLSRYTDHLPWTSLDAWLVYLLQNVALGPRTPAMRQAQRTADMLASL